MNSFDEPWRGSALLTLVLAAIFVLSLISAIYARLDTFIVFPIIAAPFLIWNLCRTLKLNQQRLQLDQLLDGKGEFIGGWFDGDDHCCGYAYFSLKGVYTDYEWHEFQGSGRCFRTAQIVDILGKYCLEVEFNTGRESSNMEVSIPQVALEEARRLVDVLNRGR